MDEWESYFGDALEVVNKLLIEKQKKYPKLEPEKIKKFLLSWTQRHLEAKKNRNLKEAFYPALVTFETTCNLAKDKLKARGNHD